MSDKYTIPSPYGDLHTLAILLADRLDMAALKTSSLPAGQPSHLILMPVLHRLLDRIEALEQRDAKY